jgi:hypothetical protein
MTPKPNHRECDTRPAAAAPAPVDRSLCALLAIDAAAFAAALWLCVSIPESLDPWAHAALAGTQPRADVSSIRCQ